MVARSFFIMNQQQTRYLTIELTRRVSSGAFVIWLSRGKRVIIARCNAKSERRRKEKLKKKRKSSIAHLSQFILKRCVFTGWNGTRCRCTATGTIDARFVGQCYRQRWAFLSPCSSRLAIVNLNNRNRSTRGEVSQTCTKFFYILFALLSIKFM